jgi:hypothetical protein
MASRQGVFSHGTGTLRFNPREKTPLTAFQQEDHRGSEDGVFLQKVTKATKGLLPKRYSVAVRDLSVCANSLSSVFDFALV